MSVFARARTLLANAIDPGPDREPDERVVGTPIIAGMHTTPDPEVAERIIREIADPIEEGDGR